MMEKIKVLFEDGNHLETRINGGEQEIISHYENNNVLAKNQVVLVDIYHDYHINTYQFTKNINGIYSWDAFAVR